MADGANTGAFGATRSLSLRVSDLVVRRPDGRAIVALPELKLPPGASLGIRGPSGAGKSTLLMALAGLLESCDGRVIWGDTDILSLSTTARARFRAENLGIVFQDFLLFDELGAAENAALSAMFRPSGERAAIRERAAALLRTLGLPDEPRRVASFSGGERQRVGVARALAADAPVLLADEPTASLDRPAADRLIGDLTGIARDQNRTLIAVSHDTHLLQRLDRVVNVIDGHVSEEAARDD